MNNQWKWDNIVWGIIPYANPKQENPLYVSSLDMHQKLLIIVIIQVNQEYQTSELLVSQFERF